MRASARYGDAVRCERCPGWLPVRCLPCRPSHVGRQEAVPAARPSSRWGPLGLGDGWGDRATAHIQDIWLGGFPGCVADRYKICRAMTARWWLDPDQNEISEARRPIALTNGNIGGTDVADGNAGSLIFIALVAVMVAVSLKLLA